MSKGYKDDQQVSARFALTVGGIPPQATSQICLGPETSFLRFFGMHRMLSDMVFIAGIPLKFSNVQPTTSSLTVYTLPVNPTGSVFDT